jgi:tellurite resistance protein
MPVRPSVPASFFGIILGLVGLGSNWRVASVLWDLPQFIGEAIMAMAGLVWLVLVLSYVHKWLVNTEAALAEAAHPVQCCFIGLAPASMVLMAVAVHPYAHGLAVVALVLGTLGQVAFWLWRFGAMLQGNRDIATTTPVLYLPSVAGNFIVAIGCGMLGYTSWGVLFLGAGVFGWLSLESIIIYRLFHATPLAIPLRPTLGIQLAPPVVAVAAWLANSHELPGLVVQAAWGYGLLQALLLLRLLPWVLEQPFTPAYWGFSFGVTALSGDALQMTSRGVTGAIPSLTPALFGFTNLVIVVLVVGTVLRIVQGKLLPAPVAATQGH